MDANFANAYPGLANLAATLGTAVMIMVALPSFYRFFSIGSFNSFPIAYEIGSGIIFFLATQARPIVIY